MEQTQELKIAQEAIEIKPVDEKTKYKLIKWLQEDVKLIGNQIAPQALSVDLPKFCRNGVLYGDLLNRLNGREEVVKGLNRAPKKLTSINANFDKTLSYLKGFPRFSSRYLWA